MFPAAEPARHQALKVAALATGLATRRSACSTRSACTRRSSDVWVERCRAQIAGALAALEADRAARPGDYWFGEPHRPCRHRRRRGAALHRRGACRALVPMADFPALAAHAARLEALPVFQAIAVSPLTRCRRSVTRAFASPAILASFDSARRRARMMLERCQSTPPKQAAASDQSGLQARGAGGIPAPPRAAAAHRDLRGAHRQASAHADAIRDARQDPRRRHGLAEPARPPDRHGPRHDAGRDRAPARPRLHRRARPIPATAAAPSSASPPKAARRFSTPRPTAR